ncbi:manganese efflux pump MntP family protein [Clostridium sp. SHJSY1]|uniref:manganese efflux pump MntP n=1 Tax=Clostridium sp. SHJSY1 TaxID=2942483 RepID=UPI0028748F6D|nr:manganese efflux pump MntP family protein [Clostridium sp. SHJSY1]MDS0528417.1 manganese efflux pump MntP family protein [Clostridium sp. SHJSY1]
MSLLSIILIGFGLSMDAFAVSLTVGISTNNDNKMKMALKSGIFFGVFQGIMPLIGWAVGISFTDYIEKIDHWIAFVLLAFIGGKMFIESIKGEDDESDEGKEYTNKRFLILAIATSIDALAVGVSFAFLNVNIISAVIIIAIITLILCIFAVYLGKVLGAIFKSRAEMLGGLILILIGLKILIEHLLK